MSSSSDSDDVKFYAKMAVLAVTVLAVVIGLIMGCIAGFKAFSRSQAMADAKNQAQIALVQANNRVTVTNIEISNQAQQLKVHQMQAQIRKADAVGVREAQDEIAKTLTPLYIQFEYAQALEDIAKSGRNNSVVYIPSGNGGVPLVAGANGQPSVGSGH